MLELSFVRLYIVWNNDASEELVKKHLTIP